MMSRATLHCASFAVHPEIAKLLIFSLGQIFGKSKLSVKNHYKPVTIQRHSRKGESTLLSRRPDKTHI